LRYTGDYFALRFLADGTTCEPSPSMRSAPRHLDAAAVKHLVECAYRKQGLPG
jgi:hypothetical protein